MKKSTPKASMPVTKFVLKGGTKKGGTKKGC